MESEIREITPVLFEVTVEVPWDRVEKDLNESYREIAKTARVRGFRPGKVPRGVVRQVYGRQVKAQVTGTLVEQGLIKALEEHALHVVAQPHMEKAPELKQGKPLTFTAKVEVRPKLDEVETEGIEAWRREVEVPREEVDAEIERLRHQHAEIQVPDPMRPARESDLVTIDYVVTVDGETKEEMGATGRQVDLSDDHLLPALKEGLSGTAPGEQKTIEVGFADDHPNADLKSKTAQFEVTVQGLHEKLLPVVDDEFAKDCGDYETLLELRLKIHEDLERAAKKRVETEVRDQLLDSLIEHNEIPLPPSMVQQQQQMMMYEMAQLMQLTGQGGAPTEEFFGGLEERAERRVRAGLLLSALARKESLLVTEADLEAKFQEIAEATGKHVAKVRAEYSPAQREALESQLLEEKVMAMLVERAKIHDGEPPAKVETVAESEAVTDSEDGTEAEDGAESESDADAPTDTEAGTEESDPQKGATTE